MSESPTGSSYNGKQDTVKCIPENNNGHYSKSGFVDYRSSTKIFEEIQPPVIEHELNVAKSIIQQGSNMTGDNLFDHLADLIKHVIQKRPENIVDYFEELSHNIRKHKFRIAERFPWTHLEPIDVERARTLMKLINLPIQPTDNEYDVCKENVPKHSKKHSENTPNKVSSIEKLQRKLSLNENVLRLHLYWALCGFGLLNDEVSKLSYALQKLQFHRIVEHARFWGKIYGLNKSYYIVEVLLTKSETDHRFEIMREEMIDKLNAFQARNEKSTSLEQDLNLLPGSEWQHRTEEELEKMKAQCEPIPSLCDKVVFEIPPETIGIGLNRRTYFVVTNLNDEWIELQIVSPQQIQLSRQIKKFLTGDLDAGLVSYPNFPGTEKHYLRAIIARITSGTYIAPDGYYRRLTKEEKTEVTGENEEDDLEGDEEEEEELDNDDMIIENQDYTPNSLDLLSTKSWVHFRPNILEQGRVAYFDEKRALEVLDNKSFFRLRSEEEDETDIEEADYMFDEDDDNISQKHGPLLFSKCNADTNNDDVEAWTVRQSSIHNKINQLIILRSNLWPGAYSFTIDKFSDSIYLGWGFKYTARNMIIPSIPPIQDEFDLKGLEVLDPTVEVEEAWRLSQRKILVEEMLEEEVVEGEDSC